MVSGPPGPVGPVASRSFLRELALGRQGLATRRFEPIHTRGPAVAFDRIAGMTQFHYGKPQSFCERQRCPLRAACPRNASPCDGCGSAMWKAKERPGRVGSWWLSGCCPNRSSPGLVNVDLFAANGFRDPLRLGYRALGDFDLLDDTGLLANINVLRPERSPDRPLLSTIVSSASAVGCTGGASRRLPHASPAHRFPAAVRRHASRRSPRRPRAHASWSRSASRTGTVKVSRSVSDASQPVRPAGCPSRPPRLRPCHSTKNSGWPCRRMSPGRRM